MKKRIGWLLILALFIGIGIWIYKFFNEGENIYTHSNQEFTMKISDIAKIDDDIYINGEKEQIKKLISILIDNAIKYTNSNGKIIIFLKNEKNKVKLIVKNTGEGIKNENLEKIFERFYRIDDSRNSKSGGYGLGLAIARAISEEHKGKIYAESNFRKDVSFIVEFPLIS